MPLELKTLMLTLVTFHCYTKYAVPIGNLTVLFEFIWVQRIAAKLS
jgi:hypothetical protein